MDHCIPRSEVRRARLGLPLFLPFDGAHGYRGDVADDDDPRKMVFETHPLTCQPALEFGHWANQKLTVPEKRQRAGKEQGLRGGHRKGSCVAVWVDAIVVHPKTGS
jgi:hypothetical protein